MSARATDASARGAHSGRQSNTNNECVYITNSSDDLRSHTSLLIIAQQKSVCQLLLPPMLLLSFCGCWIYMNERRTSSRIVITVDFIFSTICIYLSCVRRLACVQSFPYSCRMHVCAAKCVNVSVLFILIHLPLCSITYV